MQTGSEAYPIPSLIVSQSSLTFQRFPPALDAGSLLSG